VGYTAGPMRKLTLLAVLLTGCLDESQSSVVDARTADGRTVDAAVPDGSESPIDAPEGEPDGGDDELDAGEDLDASVAETDAAESPDARDPIADAAIAVVDVRIIFDSSPPDATALLVDAGAHRHTITIDGVNDFTADETFRTTTTGFTACVTWDADALYIGYEGPDIDADDPEKWLLAYLDVDPGTANGAALGESYRNQGADFPDGFNADYVWQWRTTALYERLRRFQTGSWSEVATPGLSTFKADPGTFVETRIPWATLGNPGTVGVITLMHNEDVDFQGTYAGLYQGSFTDGDLRPAVIGSYLLVDRAAASSPNDASNKRP
jgi:hypothetical protein